MGAVVIAGAGTATPAMWAAGLCACAAARGVRGRQGILRRAGALLGQDDARTGWSDSRDGGRDRPGAPRWVHWLRMSVGTRFGRRFGWETSCLPVGLALALLTGSVLPAVAGAAAVPLAGRALRERRQRMSGENRSAAVAALCAALAGELRAGLPPHAALAGALRHGCWAERPELAESATLLLASARFGGDVPAALRTAARQSGAEGLAAVAACWQVAVDGGAGLADGLDRIAGALRAERDQREDVRTQLAGPRSTAVMLAALPAVGVTLGQAMGADPLHVLLDTPAGLGCLLAGGLLEWAGLAWTARIVRAAEQAS